MVEQQIELIKNGGVWRFTPGAAGPMARLYADGKVEDKAGNTKLFCAADGDIDTQTSIDRIELLNDTGIVGDNLTNEASQFSYYGTDGRELCATGLDGGINWVNATLTSDGVWEVYMADGSGRKYVYLTVKAADVLGNTATNAQFYH